MTPSILALFWGLTATQLAIYVIGIAAIVAIVIIAMRVFGVSAPPWFIQVVWVIVAAFVCIGAVLLISSMMRGVA